MEGEQCVRQSTSWVKAGAQPYKYSLAKLEKARSCSVHFMSHDIMTLAELTSRAVEYIYYLQRMWAL